MSDNLPVISNGRLPATYERRLGRAARRELALIRAREDLATAKIEAIEMAGHAALSSTASLSMMELMYAQRDPHAAQRLAFVADQATVAIARQIGRLESGLR